MRRRVLIATFLIVDGLCAVALPAAGALVAAPAQAAAYVEVAGACVEAMPTVEDSLGGRVVPMARCGG